MFASNFTVYKGWLYILYVLVIIYMIHCIHHSPARMYYFHENKVSINYHVLYISSQSQLCILLLLKGVGKKPVVPYHSFFIRGYFGGRYKNFTAQMLSSRDIKMRKYVNIRFFQLALGGIPSLSTQWNFKGLR